MSVDDVRKQIEYNDKKEKKQRAVYLPADWTLDIPPAPLEWLRKYGITDEERLTYRIGWSNEDRCLVFAAYDVWGNLLLVQLRGFPSKVFYTRGFPEAVQWTGGVGPDFSGPCCVVEDYISTIRVGRSVRTMPLWGSNLSLNQVRRLSDHYEHLYLWLDWDKLAHSKKLALKAQPYFKSVSVIATEKDPKDYTDEQIRAYLGVIP